MSEIHGPEHPRGNFWFVDVLEEGDQFYDAARPTWGVFLQLSGMVAPIGIGFYKPEDAEAFIRDDILGAPADDDVPDHAVVPGEVLGDRPRLD